MSEPEERFSGLDPAFAGYGLDSGKCGSKISMEKKKEIIHEIARKSKAAPEILRSLTRSDLLEIICAEMGKEMKNTGYSKSQMIEYLLKLVSQKSDRSNTHASLLDKTQTGHKRPRNTNRTSIQLLDSNNTSMETDEESAEVKLCRNVACKAPLNPEFAFCKRCSCCICHCYDDNKDPSLWLTCGSDPSNENDSCGMSCHLECALKHERTGIVKNGLCEKLDGSFYCVSCGKINGLMGSWRRQLVNAKEARRVDALCLRLSLCHKILVGTNLYKEVHKTVEFAMNMMTNEVGPLDEVCLRMARGIVNRLSCGAEVQKLCASAVEAFDSMCCVPCVDGMQKREKLDCEILFEDSSPTSVMVVLRYDDHMLRDFLGCRLWYRKANMEDYPDQPSFIALKPEKNFKITDLSPSTEYHCKVSLFSSTQVFGVWEAKWVTPKLSTPRPALEKHRNGEIKNTNLLHSQVDSKNNLINLHSLDGLDKRKLYKYPSLKNSITSMKSISVCPSTPCKLTETRIMLGFNCTRRTEESDYDYSVRMVKWLEHEGHIDVDFRVKFLTWFSLKASVKDRRVVSAFIDALIDDPPSLAGQLSHTFMDEIFCNQKPVPRHEYCNWICR
ncbi:VIN3-like protein 2 [Cucurbita maxima]|uniref:VIN3-like protein 2 n=1 Tax=Cucurbita maxima TaxID=3661 RepID=A0A6J1KRS9_CUCMA|nr:VIN3-like protein 2 [Cucurbita maxima]